MIPNPPVYPDDPNPSHAETIDFVSNAVLQQRSQPDPTDAHGNSEPVNELAFVHGLVNLYMGEAAPGKTRATSPVVTQDFLHQKVMESCYVKSVRESQRKA